MSIIFSSLQKKTCAAKLNKKREIKALVRTFFYPPQKKHISLLFLARMWCTNHNRGKGRGEGWEGALPGSERNKTWAKKHSGNPKVVAVRDGPKRKSKLMRVTISKILVLTRLHFAGLRLIFRVNLICCSGCASGLMVLMRHSNRSVHPMSSKSAVSLLSLLGR